MTRTSATSKRRIAVVTGTRAEYGLLVSTMRAIKKHARLELHLVVTGMHLLKKFGYTVNDIIRDDGAIAVRVPMQKGTDQPLDQSAGLARGVAGVAAFLHRAKIDIVVVLGDRIEAMAGALAATTTGRALAHVHGGDVALGDFDESLRHSITKLAHLHFPATKSAARRIIRMGEAGDRVHCVGAPGLDDLREVVQEYKTPPPRSGRAIILQHASGRSPEREERVMRTILREAGKTGLSLTVIHPNTDRGHSGILRAIQTTKNTLHDVKIEVFKSLARTEYMRRLIEADVLIGNSSSGIIEAATAGTAVVNVGGRQHGRERAGRAIFDARESAASIREAIAAALRARPIMGGRTTYGDGCAGVRIADLLSRIPLNDALRRKQCTY